MAWLGGHEVKGAARLVLAGAVAQAVLWWISEPPTLFSDFYKAYYPAAELLWIEGLSAAWPFTEVGAGGFVNLPIFAWLFTPLVPLGDELAGWAFLLLGVVATAFAYWRLVRLGDAVPGAAMALALLFLVNGPLVNSLREGNTTHFILLLLVIALALLQRGASYSAGLLLGLCAIIKLPLLLFGPYFLVRRNWLAVAGGATSIAGAIALSVLDYGVEVHRHWWDTCVAPFLGRAIPAFNVQSIDGFLMRLQTGTFYLEDWTPHALSTPHTVVRTVILGVLFGAFFWAAFQRPAHGPQGTEHGGFGDRDRLEFATVPVLAVVTSPVSWSHYYLLLLLPWGLWLGGRLLLPNDAATRWLMRASIALGSLPILNLNLQPGWIGALASRTIISAWLLGGVLLLAALYRAAWLRAPWAIQIQPVPSETSVKQP